MLYATGCDNKKPRKENIIQSKKDIIKTVPFKLFLESVNQYIAPGTTCELILTIDPLTATADVMICTINDIALLPSSKLCFKETLIQVSIHNLNFLLVKI